MKGVMFMSFSFTDPMSNTTEYIYHYTSVETLLKYILPQKRLRFSKLDKTNDPEEASNHLLHYIDDIDMGPDFFIENYEKSSAVSKELIENIVLISFSQDDLNFDISNGLFSNKGFARPRMWAQYANNHTGVCLAFKRENFKKKFEKTCSEFLHYSGNVSYESVYKLLATPEFMNAKTGLGSELFKPLEEIVRERIEKYNKIYYFSKHKDWRTENEFRFVVKNDSTEDIFINIEEMLEYIILGHSFDMMLVKPIEILIEKFSKKPEILKFGYNRNNYTFEQL